MNWTSKPEIAHPHPHRDGCCLEAVPELPPPPPPEPIVTREWYVPNKLPHSAASALSARDLVALLEQRGWSVAYGATEVTIPGKTTSTGRTYADKHKKCLFIRAAIRTESGEYKWSARFSAYCEGSAVKDATCHGVALAPDSDEIEPAMRALEDMDQVRYFVRSRGLVMTEELIEDLERKRAIEKARAKSQKEEVAVAAIIETGEWDADAGD